MQVELVLVVCHSFRMACAQLLVGVWVAKPMAWQAAWARAVVVERSVAAKVSRWESG